MKRLIILTLVGYYLPGYKAGGALRTIVNMVDHLGDEFQFKVVALDRDIDDVKPYPGIRTDRWTNEGKAEIFYMSPKRRSLIDFKRLFRSTGYDIIYLNSFYSPHFTIKPLLLRRFRLIPDKALVIAPRGEFSPGALGLKSLKKRVYLRIAKLLRLYRGALWQASSVHEKIHIRQWFEQNVSLRIVPDLPQMANGTDGWTTDGDKKKGFLKIIFLSRISRMKNLAGALKMLNGLKGEIKFNIYGPIEDKPYWAECQKIVHSLPENIEVRYRGTVVHDQVGAVIMEHDLFFLPTLGENFGHVILEALCAGRLVLISDQTPWRLEEKGFGWNLPLDQPELFHKVLQKCVDMDQSDYAKWSRRAREYGYQVTQDDGVVEQNRQLFYEVVDMMNNKGC